jgi:hypothetical protein
MRTTLFLCLVSPVILAGSQDPAPGPAQGGVRETLKTFVIARLKEGGAEATIPYKPQGGQSTNAKVLSATDEGLQLSGDGKSFSASWDELGDGGLYDVARALLGKADSAVRVAWLLLGVHLKQTESKEFQALLEELWAKDVEQALKVADAVEASKPRKAGWFANVVDSGGAINPAAYRREAYASDLATLQRRLGPDYAYYHKDASEKFPTLWKPEEKTVKLDGHPWTYQIGERKTYNTDGNAETDGQALYVPDKPGDPGVDRIKTWIYVRDMQGNFSFLLKPNVSFHPDCGLSGQNWKGAAGGNLGAPVATARPKIGQKICSVTAFTSGLIATASVGGSSDWRHPCLLLPRNKVPTGVAVTNSHEFALVTVWDTAALKGQVAVIALDSDIAVVDSVGGDRSTAWAWWQSVPGMPNLGTLSGMKLLGFVDLPGMSTPTDIAAVGNRPGADPHWEGKYVHLCKLDLSKQAVRDSFTKGDNQEFGSRAGFAVVVSKYEKKVAFLDLRPLFQYYREMYLSTPENFARTRKLGPGPKDWPYSFDVEPHAKPRVVHMLQVHAHPTAVHASPFGGSGKARAFVATVDGKVLVYSVGALADDPSSRAPDVRCVGFVPVGRNPSCISQVTWDGDYRLDELLVSSRGDREIDFVKLDASLNSGRVTKRLRDSRLQDPVYVENSVTAFIHSWVLTVCDFKGKQILNYRYGTITAWEPDYKKAHATYGMGPDGKAEFECEGWAEITGHPFRLSTANVP